MIMQHIKFIIEAHIPRFIAALKRPRVILLLLALNILLSAALCMYGIYESEKQIYMVVNIAKYSSANKNRLPSTYWQSMNCVVNQSRIQFEAFLRINTEGEKRRFYKSYYKFIILNTEHFLDEVDRFIRAFDRKYPRNIKV